MLTAIQFNNQFVFKTHKINYIWTDGLLPSEFQSQHLF